MLAAFAKFKTEITTQIKPFSDYLIGQEAIAKNKSTSNANLVSNLIKIILVLAAIIAGISNIDLSGVLQ